MPESPASRLVRSRDLLLSSLQVLRRNPKLLLFPMAVSLASLVALLCFLAPSLFYPSGHSWLTASHWMSLGTWLGLDFTGAMPHLHPTGPLYGYVAVLYLASLFLATFVQVAFYHQILQAMAGERVSVRAGFAFAASRLRAIALWSLLAGAVGLIIQALERRSSGFSRLAVRLAGAAWSVAAVFAIPVLIREGAGNPVVVLRHSVRLLRRTWGESLIAYVGLTLAGWVAGLVALGTVLIAFAVAWFVPNWLALASAAAAGLGLFLVAGYLAGVMGDIYRCALYIYASEGVVPAPFTPAMMDAAWKVRPSR